MRNVSKRAANFWREKSYNCDVASIRCGLAKMLSQKDVLAAKNWPCGSSPLVAVSSTGDLREGTNVWHFKREHERLYRRTSPQRTISRICFLIWNFLSSLGQRLLQDFLIVVEKSIWTALRT